MKVKYSAIPLCLILIAIQVSIPALARSNGGNSDEDRPIRLYATAETGPIGRMESFTTARVNGLRSKDEQLIWGGEILQAPPNRSARVWLDRVGQVTLNSGAIAKLMVTSKRFDDKIDGAVLIASLIKGDVTVKLGQTAEAYVEASGSALVASRGASFRVGAGESGPQFEAMTGIVSVEAQVPQGNYSIRPVAGRANISVRNRQTREVQVQVTDENDKPVPDVPIIFSLGGSGATLGAGATTATVTTNALGIATTTVTGTAPGVSSVTATIAGTNVSTTIGVTTAAAAGVLTGTTLGIIAAVAGGAVATAVVVDQVKGNDNNNEDITQTGPPVFTPRNR